MKKIIIATLSWGIALWTSFIFLMALPYKFSGAAETVHIFTTIGAWMSNFLGTTLGELFANYGAYLVGSFELATALVLLSAVLLRTQRAKLHCLGGMMATVVMSGAVFFHAFTPLGWVLKWSENGQDYTDAGLAKTAVSILVLSVAMVLINFKKASK
jgi:hypothetical protein